MSFLTPRHLGFAVLVAVLVVVAVAGALTGQHGWSLAVLAVLLGAVVVVLLDLRHRQQVAARTGRRLEDTVATIAASLEDIDELRGRAAETAAGVTALGDLVRAQTDLVHAATDAAADRHRETTRRLAHLDFEPVNEVQALLQLLPRVPGAPSLPGTGGWALSASTLLGLWDVVVQERPTTIVECGSGSSTLWLSYAAREVGGARVVALEHKAAFAHQTEALLARHGLQDIGEVRHAPLTPADLDGETYRWYDRASVDDLDTIDLLVVDGPPKSTGPMARFPALPLLRGRLRPGALVVVDDAHRPDEQQAVRRWSEHEGLHLVRQLSRDATLFRVD